ncbi:hypothetical protein BU24DRAFT_419141 [Aaosphaeria arxii CBS 175.79]|uniref:Uncharacterized protein n=1 Tax=Aaosphaeria arxii CBS 175.79 TaxID=1450172 RepID=A0A6A5Y2T5_9PLEO|nr:uncharacterized protein BU24DRAFT_419141 [Aaosphaeria arxii CBS 175.79]KAF2019543.1 hypothetical protein BU24DRAFT_419141 [Aaosphaeria arxii CBS 175.79]
MESAMIVIFVSSTLLVRSTHSHPLPTPTPSPEPSDLENSNQETASFLVNCATLVVTILFGIIAAWLQWKCGRRQTQSIPFPVSHSSGSIILRRTLFASEFYYAASAETRSQNGHSRPIPTRRRMAGTT